MSTGTSIIEDALKRITVLSVAVPSSPEQISDGTKRLNSMIQLWLSWGIKMETVPITVPGEDLNEPIDARNAIVDNLAIQLAPDYGRSVSPDLKNAARMGLIMIKSLYQEVCIPDKVVSSTLPRGAGNTKGVDPRIFFPKGSELSG